MKTLLKIFRIIINIIVYTLIIFLAVYLLIVGYHKLIKKTNLVSFNNYYIFQIVSGSMETDYHRGDIIVAKEQSNYKVGDVITYEYKGSYITHRVHDIKDEKIITKGDANVSLDDEINKEDILGKVICKLTILGLLIKHKFFIIFVAIMLYLIDNVIEKLIKEKK